jgi:hypothetical protein
VIYFRLIKKKGYLITPMGLRRQMVTFNAGDYLIEVTTWAGLTVYAMYIYQLQGFIAFKYRLWQICGFLYI